MTINSKDGNCHRQEVMNKTIAQVKLATSSAEIQQCLPVMLQLRPHLQTNNFVRQVQQQMQTGYRLAYLQATD